MAAKRGKPKQVQISTDGKTWHDIPPHYNFRCYFPPIPGGLTMRFPDYVAQYWARGRQIDGKRAGEYTKSRSEDASQYRIKFVGGNN